jgi:hypothetical protein
MSADDELLELCDDLIGVHVFGGKIELEFK